MRGIASVFLAFAALAWAAAGLAQAGQSHVFRSTALQKLV